MKTNPREDVIAYMESQGIVRSTWIFGCDSCSCTAETCEYYYDMYNIDGDCLAEK